MRPMFSVFLITVSLLVPVSASADELAKIIQQDLLTLGYDPGNTDGEVGTKTIVAVSKFQAEHDLEITGELTPQLAGIIKASIKQGVKPKESVATVAEQTSSESSEEALRAAQQACLKEKQLAAQESSKKKRGFGKLLRAVNRASRSLGGGDVATEITRTSNNVYNANATADDLAGAAKDLGLTEDDLEDCRNP